MVKVGVLGYGTVGSGVVEILDKNKDIIAKRVGKDVSVKYVLDLRDFPGDPVEKVLVHDFDHLVHRASCCLDKIFQITDCLIRLLCCC